MRVVLVTVIACAVELIAGSSSVWAQSYKRSYIMPEAQLAPAVDDRSLMYGGASRFPAIRRIPTAAIPLPVPFDPDDMLMNEARNETDFGAGFGIAPARGSGESLAVVRIVPNVKLDCSYDTGNPGEDLSPSGFALEGSDADRGSGIFSMGTSSADLDTDIQIPSVTAQVFLKIQALEDDLDFEQVYARCGNWLGGEYFSSFMDNGTLPQSIVPNCAPAGALSKFNVVQLQYVKLFYSGILIGAAIENPTIDDYTLIASDDTRLQRAPDFVTRIRYQPLDAWGSLQGAMLLRQFGYEDIGTLEHFTSAVSFSVNARFKTFGDDNVRVGAVAGQGAGSRVFGVNAAQSAAGPEGGELAAIDNTGAFAAYQYFWSDYLWSNVAYGYADADVTSVMADATRRSQNGWINFIWNNHSGNVAIGLEYQVGEQVVGDGREGLNHHIQLSLQIGKGYEYGNAADAGDGAPAVGRAGLMTAPSAVPMGGTQLFPRM